MNKLIVIFYLLYLLFYKYLVYPRSQFREVGMSSLHSVGHIPITTTRDVIFGLKKVVTYLSSLYSSSFFNVKLLECNSLSISYSRCLKSLLAFLSFLSIFFIKNSLRYIKSRVLSVESTSVMSFWPPLPGLTPPWREFCRSINLLARRS